VAWVGGVPVWAVIGRGRCLPAKAFDSMVATTADVRVPWEAEVDTVPLGLAAFLATPHGVNPAADVTLAAECPLTPELLRSGRA
jgi:hypothetical protein